jgi:aminopeptidase N
VLTLAEEPGQIGVRQSRFLITGDAKPDEDETLWWVPLGLISDSQTAELANQALTVKEDTIRDFDEDFFKFNARQTGFYRTNYPPQRLAKLGQSKDKLGVEDKIGLVGDTAALAIAGNATTAALLALVENFNDEPNYA